MSKIEVDAITEQSGSTLTTGGGAGKTVVVDATTVTLGRCGGTVALASGASQSGFGRTGTVDWQTGSIKTATFTAASGEGYFCNTTGGAFEVDLPAGSAGAIVSVQDYNNTFDSNNLTVDPNGSEKINGGTAGEVVVLKTEGRGVTFVYIDSTVGWRSVQDNDFAKAGAPPMICASVSGSCNTITEDGDYKIATFKGPGNFTVNSIAASAPDNIVDYLVVAGGGSSGNGNGNSPGGGGAGGVRASAVTYTNAGPSSPRTPTSGPTAVPGITVTAQAYPIVVGAGDSGQTGPQPNPGTRRGSDSSGLGITSTGGGAGGYHAGGGGPGNSGGSGGGASGGGLNKTGGAGNTPPVSPSQGLPGGSRPGTPPDGGGGSGAGMMGCGVNGSPAIAAGGAGGGFPNAFGTSGENCGSYYYFGGGGAAGGTTGTTPAPSAAVGGLGGGGNFAATCGGVGCAGTVNTGGGGGGPNNGPYPVSSASGGSGIVIIRYKFQ